MPKRIYGKTRIVAYPQPTWDSDAAITEGFIPGQAGTESIGTDQAREQIPVSDGTRQSLGSELGEISAGGDMPLGQDYDFKAFLAAHLYGGYTRDTMGSNSLHKLTIDEPLLMQLQKEYLQSPVLYKRNRNVLPNTISMTSAVAGFAQYMANLIGDGWEGSTDLAGTKTPTWVRSSNYYNGYILIDGASGQGKIASFSLRLTNGVGRQGGVFNAGRAVMMPSAFFMADGDLGYIFEDMVYYDAAINGTPLNVECLYGNAPQPAVSGVGPTQWERIRIPAAQLSRVTPKTGGQGAIVPATRFTAERPSVGTKAEIFGPTRGTFNVTGANNTLRFITNIGTTASVVLTSGAARTVDQIVGEINAAGLANVTADNWMGYLRLKNTHTATGVTSTLAWDTTVGLTAHALFGGDATVRTGRAASMIYHDFFNQRTTDYPLGGKP